MLLPSAANPFSISSIVPLCGGCASRKILVCQRYRGQTKLPALGVRRSIFKQDPVFRSARIQQEHFVSAGWNQMSHFK